MLRHNACATCPTSFYHVDILSSHIITRRSCLQKGYRFIMNIDTIAESIWKTVEDMIHNSISVYNHLNTFPSLHIHRKTEREMDEQITALMMVKSRTEHNYT
ncbi:uncharacterized protein LOC144238093 isoform X2 [Crocuta crocuta]